MLTISNKVSNIAEAVKLRVVIFFLPDFGICSAVSLGWRGNPPIDGIMGNDFI